MKKRDITIGGTYRAKVSGKVVAVKITGCNEYGGWNAVNTETGRAIRVRTAGRLRPCMVGDLPAVVREEVISNPTPRIFSHPVRQIMWDTPEGGLISAMVRDLSPLQLERAGAKRLVCEVVGLYQVNLVGMNLLLVYVPGGVMSAYELVSL